MGRVTVFVSNECADCQLVLHLFQKYAIPFQEINVDTYPRKRSSMIKLTDCLTTPQVFFNEKHIGGATSVTTLFKKYHQEAQWTRYSTVLERISAEVLDRYMATEDKQMFKITAAERYAATSLSDQHQYDRSRIHDLVEVTEDIESTICKISRDLLKWLPRRHTNRLPILFKSHKSPACNNYFKGSEAIKAFMKYYNLPSSDRAVAFGQKLLRLGIIHRIGVDSLQSHIFAAKAYFRLQPLQSPDTLNSFRIWTQETGLNQLSPDPILTLSRLLQQMVEIIISATNDVGIVDYHAAQKNSRFSDFEEAVCQLQMVDFKDIDENTKKTFFINIYNLMAKHAFVKLCPKKVKKGMFDKVNYNVGGFIFSLDDIYHGILRRNSKHPKRLTKMFLESDLRVSFVLKEEDPRIHFALNNANHTTLYEYHVDAINEELRVVAELYCKSNKRLYISSVENKVVFPKFMRVFLSDVTTDEGTRSLLEVIVKYLRMDSARFFELNSMLERENINDERVTVRFKKKLSQTRLKLLRRTILRKIISYVRLFYVGLLKQNTSQILKDHSIIHDKETVKCHDSPLGCVDVEESPKRRLSDLTWDSSAHKDLGHLQHSPSTPMQSSFPDKSRADESMAFKSTFDILNTKLRHQTQMIASQNPDYSVGDESSSQISYNFSKSDVFTLSHADNGSTNKLSENKAPDHAHVRKTKPEYPCQNFSNEFTLSDCLDNYSTYSKSTIDLTPPSNIDSNTGVEAFTIANIKDYDSLYSNVNNEYTSMTYGDDYSEEAKFTINPQLSTDGRIISDLGSESSDIPSINEVHMEMNALFNTLFSKRK